MILFRMTSKIERPQQRRSLEKLYKPTSQKVWRKSSGEKVTKKSKARESHLVNRSPSLAI